ncbi:MAG: GGDEF domain-containing protein [Bacteroidales bacterium]|nr:GGDEF domain-containing protein [Lachnoclostridium sp.]MCM1383339.1 GGDEF domain-containing protein [Lachnoclostridium sp.]MCM1465004.1 GGDEF domain-containing protein [Bacteroidales bacterium]
MGSINITEYASEDGEYQMYYGKASLKEGYYLANCDERCYHLIGKKNGHFSMPELIHPEDAEAFLDAVQKLDEGPQHLFVRFLCYTNQYRCIYMVLYYNGRDLDGFRSIDVELSEIMAISRQYSKYQNLVVKYREFMTMCEGLFLEYDYATDMLIVYQYVNSRSQNLLKEKMEQVYIRVLQDERLKLEQKAEFQTLYEAVKNGREHIKTGIDSMTLWGDEESANCHYEIKLGALYAGTGLQSMVGMMEPAKGEQEQKKSYYLTDSAFDPGTGLLNKRAIKEYAVERIQSKAKGVWLAIIDIDDFKQVNDNFGHMYGDEVLSRLAEIIRSVIKTRGVVGRFGGDEFMVVFEGVETEESLRVMLGTMGRNIAWEFSNVEGLKVSTTTGVAKYPEDGTDYDKLFRTADKCVYIGKSKGKNRYIIYDIEKHGPVEETEEGSGRIDVSQSKFLSEERKCEIVSDLMISLHKGGKKALLPVLEQLLECFGTDGIALYAGESMERICSVGKYENPIQSLACVRENASYWQFLDKQGFAQLNITMLENKVPELFELYSRQETEKALQCVAIRDGLPAAVVSFDVFHRIIKFGETDLGLIKIAGRMLADIIAE